MVLIERRHGVRLRTAQGNNLDAHGRCGHGRKARIDRQRAEGVACGRALVSVDSAPRSRIVSSVAAGPALAWRVELDRPERARDLAVDGGGAGFGDFTVIELDSATGTESWRYSIDIGVADVTHDVAVDGAGDVFAAGVLIGAGGAPERMEVELGGATGVFQATASPPLGDCPVP